MDLNGFLLNILAILPGLLLSIYLAIYLTLHFSFYRNIDRSSEAIRKKAIDKWTSEYSSIGEAIKGIEIKYIRVLSKPVQKENRLFRFIQLTYFLISIFLIIFSIYLQSIVTSSAKTSSEISYLILSSIAIYSIVLTIVVAMSGYEWSYYSLLDDLDKHT